MTKGIAARASGATLALCLCGCGAGDSTSPTSAAAAPPDSSPGDAAPYDAPVSDASAADASAADASPSDVAQDVAEDDASAAGDADASTDAQSPITCVAPAPGVLQNVLGVTHAPYLVHHPANPSPQTQTIMFLPGGSGSLSSAQFSWKAFLASDARVDDYRILIPYSDAGDLIDDITRAFETLDATLACYGGDPARVHVAGFSNGGRMAFAFMFYRPDRFVTLLGAPGLFPASTPEARAAALAGRPVFNGVGELDDVWQPDVKATHDGLVAAGANSVYVEFPSQGHAPPSDFDPVALFDFWSSH